MHIIIDLDGVIAKEREDRDYAWCIPLPGAVKGMLALKELGHTITIFSSRFPVDYELTAHWLYVHNIPYDSLILGKPRGDLYIDDRGLRFTGWYGILGEINEISN